MSACCALRLLGFLGSDTSVREVERARKECCATLGLPDPGGVDAAVLAALRPVLAQRGLKGAFEETAPGAARTTGLLCGAVDAKAAPPGTVVAVERVNLRGEPIETLAKTALTAHGQYAAAFAAPADTLVCASFTDKSGTSIHRSPPRKAGPDGWYEWSDGGGAVPVPGRFEIRAARLDAALAATATRLSDLAEGPGVAAVAELTGLPEHVVAHHLRATKLGDRLGVRPDVAAALLGAPARPGERRLPPAELDREAAHGPFARVLAAPKRPELAESERALLSHAPDLVARLVADAASAGELSAAAARTLPDVQARLAAKSPARPVAPGVVAPEIAGLGDDPRVIEPLRRIGARAAARMPADALDSALGAAVPKADERRRIVEAIARNADRALPGDALLRRRLARVSEPTRRFLEQRGNSFHLLDTFVDGELFGSTAEGSVRPEDRWAVREDLLRLQRVARVARDAAVADVLLSKGYESAQQIAFAEPTAFVSTLESAGVPREGAELVRRRALAQYRATVEAYLHFNPDAAGPTLPSLAPAAGKLTDPALLSIPTYAYLFGSQDYGVVEDWESVTSTGAYLVDLLVWLSRAPRVAGALHPYDVVVARRPDLVDVVLDGPNAKTLVPHIDLACELLEDAVAVRAHLRRIDPKDRQTRLTEKEVRAYPEHVNAQVYELLRTSTQAMSLPFDLPLLELRGYLALPALPGGSTSHPALVALLGSDLFASPGKPTPAALRTAAAVFGLDETDVDVLVTARPDPASQAQIWGSATVSSVAEFLRRAPASARPHDHLTYAEGMVLLAGRFIDPTRTIQIRLADGVTEDRCKVEDRVFDPPLAAATLDRVHRFLRLARRTGWTFCDLDVLFQACGALDDLGLVKLAALRGLQDRLALPAEEIALFLRDFGEDDAQRPRPDGTQTLYRRIYLVRSDAQSVPDVFLKASAAPAPISAHLDRIRAGLGLSGDELSSLLAFTGLTSAPVSFRALSILARHATLARATSGGSEHPIDEHLALVGVLGDPFPSAQTLLEHVEAVSQIRTAGLDGAAAACICGLRDPNLPDVAALNAALDELREATRAALEKSGAAAGAQDVRRALVASGAWATPVASWAGGDARTAALARALDAAGQVSEPILDAAEPQRTAALQRIGRLVALASGVRLTAEEVESLHDLSSFAALWAHPSGKALLTLLADLALARDGSSVAAIVGYRRALEKTTELRPLAAIVAEAFGLEARSVEALWRRLEPADPVLAATAGSAPFLSRLRDGVRLAQAFRVSPASLVDWATQWPTAANAAAVREAVRALFPRDAWLERSAQVQDRLRAQKRDALVDYLVATAPATSARPELPEPRTVADFAARFLLDVEMGPERNTSRVVQAAAAVQALVQRCLLGLEPEIVPDASAAPPGYWGQWEWRKRYRLWEANRKIYLYPENFLTLNNRANASPLFKDFRKRILQGEISEENVSQALEEYLVGLEDVSRLSYECMDLYTNAAGATVLGVVGRSAGTPPTYYYRRLEGGIWTPWEEVALGASVGTLALAQADRRAWIVWPTTADQLHPDQDVPAAKENDTPPNDPGQGITYVRYSWTMRDDRGVWTPAKTTSRALLMEPRNARAFVVNVRGDYPTPQAFTAHMFSPDRQMPGDAVFWTSQMEVVRDTTQARLVPRMAWFDGKQPKNDRRWGDHWAEYRYSTLDATESRLDPWDGMHFDGNRLVADPATRFVLKVPKVDGSGLELLGAPSPVFSTKPRGYRTDPQGARTRPMPNAFVVSGGLLNGAAASWAMVFVAPEVQKSLIPAVTCDRLKLSPDRYLAIPAYHPFVRELLAQIRSAGIRGVFTAAVQESPSVATVGRAPLDLGEALGLSAANVSVLSGGQLLTPGNATHPPRECFDFDALCPYGLYNYETFFFAPLLVAQQLSAAQRFDLAQAYFHFIFNPLSTEPGSTSARFWVTRPFRQNASTAEEDVQSILSRAATPGTFRNPWDVIEQHPFDPHAVAASRPTAYQKYVVRGYLQNLIDWGDQYYRRNTREDVDEAIPIYQLAQTILGERPDQLPLLGARPARAFVQPSDWLGGSNILVQLEALVRDAGEAFDGREPIHLPLVPRIPGSPKALYFRVPKNEQLLAYWDVVETRLRNIRASLTISGAVASLDLEAAPIDPQALADAAALGLSVADAIAMASAAPPPYRFRVVHAKALEDCSQLKALGAALLAAMEKRDGEHLARVRSQFEKPVLDATRAAKLAQRVQTLAEVEALRKQREVVDARKNYYASREYMNDLEKTAFGLNVTAGVLDAVGAAMQFTSGGLRLIPDFTIGVSGFGGTPEAGAQTGGGSIGDSVEKFAAGMSKIAALTDRAASLVSTQAGYARREDDWKFQSSQAALELAQLDKQIAAANLRVAVLDAELKGQDAQDAAWTQSDQLLREKFTHTELYDWCSQRLLTVYRRAWGQAFQLASLAREAYVFETGDDAVERPDAAEWDRDHSGLLAGEGLEHWLRELEIRNLTRLPETAVVTQHVSLSQVAPAALVALVTTGTTGTFTIPAWWFKRLYPGLGKRRVRSVAVSIPCVAGAYVSVNASLAYGGSDRTLQKAIALSTGSNDFGFDVSTRNERYMPFERVSLDVDTPWCLSFPQNGTDVDLSTIADVVLHFEYGAEEGADPGAVPAQHRALVDLARSAPDAWIDLVGLDRPHACTFDATPLLPSFLDGFRVAGVASHAVVDRDGKVRAGAVTCAVQAGDGPGKPPLVKIAAAAGTTVPWEDIRHVFVVLDVARAP